MTDSAIVGAETVPRSMTEAEPSGREWTIRTGFDNHGLPSENYARCSCGLALSWPFGEPIVVDPDRWHAGLKHDPELWR